MEFSEILKRLREEHGYTQEKLASVIHVSKNSVSHYERNISMPEIDVLIGIAEVFDVSIDYLLGRTEFNLSHEKLKKVVTKNLSVGQLVEKISNLDQSHKLDLYKALYYIERDNRQNKS